MKQSLIQGVRIVGLAGLVALGSGCSILDDAGIHYRKEWVGETSDKIHDLGSWIMGGEKHGPSMENTNNYNFIEYKQLCEPQYKPELELEE